MTAIPQQRPTLSSTSGTGHARIWAVGGYRPERVVTNDEICKHIDSSDQWIRERTGIVTRRFAAPEETVVDMASAAALEALRPPASPPPRSMRSSSPRSLTRTRPPAPLPWSPTVSAPHRRPRLTSPPPAPATVTGSRWPTTWSVVAAPGSSWSSGSRSCPTSPTRPTVARRSSSATEPVPQWSARRTSPASARRCGVLTAPSGRRSPSATPGSRCATSTSSGRQSPWPASRCSAGRSTRWPRSPTLPSTRRASRPRTSTPSSPTRPTCASSRLVKQLKLPEHIAIARDIADTGNTSAASVPLATKRMLDSGEAPHGGLALQIAFGAGLVYAAQVIVLP